MADIEALKQRVCDEVDRLGEVLVDASHELHAHPELCFEEVRAHDLLTGILEDHGLATTRQAYGLETAFEARAGSEGPVVAVCAEYDALPDIGHACGHNIIGTAALGAGLAAAVVADEVGGRVRVLGTPAEEGGGGKIKMADAGAFEDVDAAMMVHPAGADLRRMNVIATTQLWAEYEGAAAHAAAFPWKGRNALDAAVLGYNNVAALRQHLRSDERVHGIFTEAGEKPNIVPARAAAHWYVRAGTLRHLDALKERVVACLRAGAHAAGCEVEIRWHDVTYSDMADNGPMIDLYAANAARLGREVVDPLQPGVPLVVGSTDMGNVSHLVPSIHPMIAVSPPHVAIHTPDFARYAGGEEGDRAVVDGAKAMAMTIVDLWSDPDSLSAAKAQLEATR